MDEILKKLLPREPLGELHLLREVWSVIQLLIYIVAVVSANHRRVVSGFES